MRIEIRNDSVVLDGYVNAVLRESRELSSPNGKFVEEILPKTFERAINSADSVDLLFNHNKNRKLGSTKEGNLDLREDNVGLRATATIYDEEVMQKARNGELRGWSFGFSVLRDSWKRREDGIQKRSVSEMELYEISVLDKTPAYIATSIETRGETDSILTETRIEEFRAKVEDKTKKDEESEKDEEKKVDKAEDSEENEKDEEKAGKSKETEDKGEKSEDTKKQNEKRENALEIHYFENLEKEVTLLKLKGGL